MFVLSALFYWLRQLTAKTQARQMAAVEAGAPPGVAAVIADTTNTPEEVAVVALGAQ
jgi:hypothetical protein